MMSPFDPYAEETLEDPFSGYGKLLTGCPVQHYSREGHDFVAIGRYADVKAVLRDGGTWSSRFGPGPKDLHPIDGGLNSDAPRHTEWRRIYGARLMPKELEKLAPVIEALANELIDDMLAKSSGDLHDDFAMPLVAKTMATVVGLPMEDYLIYKRCADEVLVQTFNSLELDAGKNVLQEVFAILRKGIAQRRAVLAEAGVEVPDPSHVGTLLSDDLLSVLVCARFEGRPMTDTEMLTSCLSFFTGGAETTASQILMCLHRLLETPGYWEKLKANPDLIEMALEESLRFDPPALSLFRKNICPAKIHDVDLQEGTRLMFSIVSANRDPEVFSNPDQFDIERSPSEIRKHLSFGFGPHTCIGSGLARLEARTALLLLIERLPNLQQTGPLKRIPVFNYWGTGSFPAAW